MDVALDSLSQPARVAGGLQLADNTQAIRSVLLVASLISLTRLSPTPHDSPAFDEVHVYWHSWPAALAVVEQIRPLVWLHLDIQWCGAVLGVTYVSHLPHQIMATVLSPDGQTNILQAEHRQH